MATQIRQRRAVKGEVSKGSCKFEWFETPAGLTGRFQNFDMNASADARSILKAGGWVSAWCGGSKRDGGDFVWVCVNNAVARQAAQRAAAL